MSSGFVIHQLCVEPTELSSLSISNIVLGETVQLRQNCSKPCLPAQSNKKSGNTALRAKNTVNYQQHSKAEQLVSCIEPSILAYIWNVMLFVFQEKE